MRQSFDQAAFDGSGVLNVKPSWDADKIRHRYDFPLLPQASHFAEFDPAYPEVEVTLHRRITAVCVAISCIVATLDSLTALVDVCSDLWSVDSLALRAVHWRRRQNGRCHGL